jgi:hypothetical protein
VTLETNELSRGSRRNKPARQLKRTNRVRHLVDEPINHRQLELVDETADGELPAAAGKRFSDIDEIYIFYVRHKN